MKSHIRKTLNLSTDGDSSTDTIKTHQICFWGVGSTNVFLGRVQQKMWGRGRCHQQPQPRNLPLLTPPLSRVGWVILGWLRKPEMLKNAKKIIDTKTKTKNGSSQANISDTPFDQKSLGLREVGVLNCHRHTDIKK